MTVKTSSLVARIISKQDEQRIFQQLCSTWIFTVFIKGDNKNSKMYLMMTNFTGEFGIE